MQSIRLVKVRHINVNSPLKSFPEHQEMSKNQEKQTHNGGLWPIVNYKQVTDEAKEFGRSSCNAGIKPKTCMTLAVRIVRTQSFTAG